ncbi:hypothetical protein EMCG_06834 [[Emmonsia] crescens]|uniref:C2H2-type domain-containing protein n=1 Tax=[Emmonsia] crescens TaxID=73230 RepID=A0A0G2IAC5_9EURO|nr:hypothetical protein EMCG_06834 [Emmonsia crescens UAMH 3008]
MHYCRQDQTPPQHIQKIDYPVPVTRDFGEMEVEGDSQSNELSPTVQIDKSPNSSQRVAKRELLSVQCTQPGCGRTFSDRACLLRHRREVHKVSTRYKAPGTHPCPIVKCPRHTRTFARLWNLHNHMKVHGQGSERLHKQMTVSSSGHKKRRESPKESELGGMGSPILNVSDARPLTQSLQTKLECLLEERRELDEKIRALRNAQRIMEDMN